MVGKYKLHEEGDEKQYILSRTKLSIHLQHLEKARVNVKASVWSVSYY